MEEELRAREADLAARKAAAIHLTMADEHSRAMAAEAAVRLHATTRVHDIGMCLNAGLHLVLL